MLICWYVCNVVCWDVDIRTKCICKLLEMQGYMQVIFVLVCK